jgi:uncharacterized Tic20 family protein
MEEQGSKTQLERVLAALAHGSIGIVGALSIWLVMKGRSAYVRGQALQAVVYQVAVVVLWLVGSIVWVILWFGVAGGDIGSMPDWVEPVWIAFPVGFAVLAILYALWGAVRCLGGHDFRYAIVGKLVDRWI